MRGPTDRTCRTGCTYARTSHRTYASWTHPNRSIQIFEFLTIRRAEQVDRDRTVVHRRKMLPNGEFCCDRQCAIFVAAIEAQA